MVHIYLQVGHIQKFLTLHYFFEMCYDVLASRIQQREIILFLWKRKILYKISVYLNISASLGTCKMLKTQTIISVQLCAHILRTQVHQMLQLQKGRSLQQLLHTINIIIQVAGVNEVHCQL